MGICASCLGLGRRDPPDSESSPLIVDDDLYQANYGYGALNHAHQANSPDPGYMKREREALEAICQRTSDSVIDIWSLQPQPHLQPQATLRSSVSPASSRGGSARASSSHDAVPIHLTSDSSDAHANTTPNMTMNTNANTNTPADPKHWGEVVINTRKGKKKHALAEPEQQQQQQHQEGRDVFGVLKVT